MLEINNIHTYYGLSHVLFGVSLIVNRGEAVCLLGRNGVGKTTTIKSIMGLNPPKSGAISFEGRDITKLPSRQRVKMGICYVPDDRRIFADLTVYENLEVAIAGASKKRKDWTVERVYELFPALKEFGKRKGGFLSGGQQQMLSIARALLGNPELLILDEPTEGLAPLVVEELVQQILMLKSIGISILIAEQNLKSALKIADRCYVLEKGHVCYEGSADEFSQNHEVKQKYLAV